LLSVRTGRTFAAAYVLLLVLLPAKSAPCQSEQPDSTASHRYFPLQPGNEWHYVETEPGTIRTTRWIVGPDSVVEDTTYHRVTIDRFTPDGDLYSSWIDLLRYDSLNATVFELVETGNDRYELVWNGLPGCLDAAASDYYLCDADNSPYTITESTEQAVVVGLDTVLVESVKSFGGLVTGFVLASDLGVVARTTQGGSDQWLEYARIDQKVFGSPHVPTSIDAERRYRRTPRLIAGAFPNPVSDRLTVLLDPNAADLEMAYITDLLGRRLFVITSFDRSNRLTVDASALRSGLYFLNLTAGKSSDIRPFVVND